MDTQYRKNLKAVMQKSKEYTDNIYTLATNNIAGKDTSTNILAKTSDDGIWVGSDTGYWYFWDGEHYVDGGLFIPNVLYTEITDLNYDLNNLTNYGNYMASSTITNTMINKPNLHSYNDGGCVIKVEKSSLSDSFLKQTFIYAKGYTIIRYYINGVWTDWSEILTNKSNNEITSSSYNLNNLTEIGIYEVSGTITNTLVNKPNLPYTTGGCIIKVEKASKSTDFLKQTFIYGRGYTCVRYYIIDSWTNWDLCATDKNIINPASLYTQITTTYYDLNNLSLGTYVVGAAVTNSLVNKPTLDYVDGGCVIKVERSSYDMINFLKQTFIYAKGKTWVRYYVNGTWTEWGEIITSTNNTNIPNYWYNEIKDSIDKVYTNALNYNENGDKFIFITDEHWRTNAQKSPYIINELCKQLGVNLVINGGDVLATTASSKINAITEMNNFFNKFDLSINLISTIGNHDLNNSYGGQDNPELFLTENNLYPLMVKRCEKFTDTNKNVNFYYDNEIQKVRYITIQNYTNTLEFSNDTKTFLQNACNSLSSDWKIVIFEHLVWDGATSGENPISTNSMKNCVYLADLKESINANIICVLCGHTHRDLSTTISSTSGNTNLLFISCNTDNYTSSSNWQGASMTLGTDTEQAISIIQLDFTNEKIYITRCGAGNDRDFNY